MTYPFYSLLIILIISFTKNVSISNIDSSAGLSDETLVKSEAEAKVEKTDSSLTLKDTITIIGVGDIMLGTNYPSSKYLPPENDCKPLLQSVLPILKDADVTFGNLEGTFLNTGSVAKRCKDPTKCYTFRMPEAYVKCLAEADFDILSLANNHSYDFGQPGIINTIRLLDENDILYAGLLTHPTSIFIKNNIKFGFCAFSPNSGTCDIRNISNAQRIVRELDKQCDIVIVSFHGGAEGKSHQHVTRKIEIFYGENRGNVYEFAHKVIDAGADIVFGHGPHVTRAIEIYKNKFIIYSLGNFCTYARFNLSGANGIAPIIKLSVNKNGKFLKGKIIPIVQSGEGGSKIDTLKRAIYKLKELTKQDFPEQNISITDNGDIIQN